MIRTTCALVCLALAFASPAAMAQAHDDEAELRAAERELLRNPSDNHALRRVLDLSHAAGGLRAMIASYETKVGEHPRDAALRLVLGHLLRHSGRCADALPRYAEAARLSPNQPGPHLGSAECHRLSERWADAMGAYEAAVDRLRDRDERVSALQQLVEVALRAEREDIASEAYQQLIRASPTDPLVRVEHARALVASNRVRMAIDVWRGIHRMARSDQKTRVLAVRELGQLYLRQGQADEAITLYRAELRRLPAEHWAVFELQEGLISVYRREGRLGEYVTELERQRRSYPILLLLARLYEEVGQDRKALEAYRRAATQRPANVDARAAMLRILKRIGSHEELEAEYRRLIRAVPQEPRYELELARLYFETGKAEKGFALLDRMSRRFAQDPGVHEEIVDLLLRNEGDRERVEREFSALARLEPDEDQHIVQLGEYYFGEGERGKAVSTWSRLLRVVSDEADAHLLLARLYAEHEMQDEAITHFREAIKQRPRRIKYYRSFAVYLEKVNLYRDAIGAWQKIMELLEATDHRRIREARQRVVRIILKQDAPAPGELGYKLEAYRHGFEASPPDVESGLFLAEGLVQLKEFERARTVLERIVALRSQDPEALLMLGEVYEKLNRLGDAIAALQRIADIDPATARERLQRMAELALELHNTQDALRYARLVVDLNPTDADALAHLGDIHVRMRNFTSALEAYRKSLALLPGSFGVQFKLAQVLERLGREAELIEALTRVVETATEPADILNAGRRIMTSPELAVLERLEPVLLQATFRRAHKPIYRKLLIDLYAAMVKRLSMLGDDPDDDEAATRRLRAIGERGLKPILDSLGDSDLAVRTRVLRVLVSTRNSGAVLPLVRLLEEKDRVLRFQALVALAHIGMPSAIDPIAKLVGERRGNVGVGAIWALGAFGDRRALPTLEALSHRAQGRADTPAVVALALGARGNPDGLTAALHLFQSASGNGRAHAAWALGAMRDPRAVEPLLRRLPLESDAVRRTIVWALGAIGSPRALEPLLKVVWGHESALVPMARWALQRILNPSEFDHVELRERYLALHDFDTARLELARAFPALLYTPPAPTLNTASLVRRHGPAVKRTLLAQLTAPEASVQSRLLAALIPDDPSTRALVLGPLAPDTPVPQAWRAEVVQAVISRLSASAVESRIMAARALGRSGSNRAGPALAEALGDESPGVRREAALGLAALGASSAVPLLLQAVSSGPTASAWSGRAAVCVALQKLLAGAPDFHGKAAQVLGTLLLDEYPIVRREALEALRLVGPAALQTTVVAVELLADPDAAVRLSAVHTLGAIGSPVALKPLEALTTDPWPELRRAATDAVRRIREGGSG